MEEHNIFHSEVEALAPHISTGGDKVPADKQHQVNLKCDCNLETLLISITFGCMGIVCFKKVTKFFYVQLNIG